MSIGRSLLATCALLCLPVAARTAEVGSAPSEATASTSPSILVVRPFSGAAAGGVAASVYGGNFQPGATVSIGGIPATGITVPDATRIDFTVPALTPGTINDVVVTNPDSMNATLAQAWFAGFLDVPPSQLFRRQIEKLRRRRITTGCGAGIYCPDDSVTRAQMAVFILRGKHGSGYHPPPAVGTVFDDVPKTVLFADWIEEFAAEGITTGCGGKNYCPNNPVTRGEMAVFLLRAKHGSTHNPPVPTGVFGDVPPGAPFAKWIEELAAEAITSGCGGGNYCPTIPSSRGQMAVFLNKTFSDTAQELIAEDLAWGDIDYATSLLYRFYALFWDGRLPARYDSAGSSGEDSNLLEEAQLVLLDLTAEQQAALQPFLARPDDPGSVFGPSGSSAALRRAAAGITPDTQCTTSWTGTSASGSHFRVHLCSSSDPAADTALRASVNQLADGLWTPMTAAPPAGMGPPKADCYDVGGMPFCPGGDDKIDIYLLSTKQCRDRGGRCLPIPGNAVAMAPTAPPRVGKTASGYILLARDRAGDPATIKSDFAHEFFHILQSAHNSTARFVDTGARIGSKTVWDECWFTEASATWAEWKFVPATAVDQVYLRFSRVFQTDHLSLLTNSPDSHPYASFIWPYFSQQEKGAAAPVFQAWVSAEAASDSDGITDAVDSQLPFAAHFRDFAVRNIDITLSGNPLGVTYQVQDKLFPEDLPDSNKVTLPAVGERTILPVAVVALAARYDAIDIEDPAVRKIILRFDKVPGLDVDILAGNAQSGTWKRIKVGSKPVVFCRDIPEQNVYKLYVILSNHDKTRGNKISGSYEIESRPSCCDFAAATSWKAHISFTYSHSGNILAGFDVQASHSADVSSDLTPIQMEPDVAEFLGEVVTGTASIHDQEIFTSKTNKIDGQGPPIQGSMLDLLINPISCTYTFSLLTALDATGPDGISGPSDIGILWKKTESTMKDAADVLEESASFAAQDVFCVPATGCDTYYPGGYALDFDLSPGAGAGAAEVSWKFEPVLPKN